MYQQHSGAKAAPTIADLRSDTVTKPTPGMRAAMAGAELGDDVYGDDPSVNRLEAHVAELLGKEAALFCASGTQSNLLGMLAWCGRGEEVLTGRDYHVFAYEARGASVLGGVAMEPLDLDADGALAPEAIAAAVKPDDSHKPVTRLVSFENTVSGRVAPLEKIRAGVATARAHGLATHLDGARMMNAAVALGLEPAEIAGLVDSVSLCLSKGLGAPIGSVLAGPAELVARARRLRKMVGGGMRQAGLLAAAGLYALERQTARLAEDHARAARLAQRLGAIDALTVEGVATNMLFVRPQPADLAPLLDALASAGVRVNAGAPSLRLVTHLDIDDAALDAAATAFERFYAARAA